MGKGGGGWRLQGFMQQLCLLLSLLDWANFSYIYVSHFDFIVQECFFYGSEFLV